MAENNNRDDNYNDNEKPTRVKNMTISIPVITQNRDAREKEYIKIKLSGDSAANRWLTDVMNEIPAVMMLVNGYSEEEIAEYSEAIENVNDVKYLLNCELTNNDIRDPEELDDNRQPDESDWIVIKEEIFWFFYSTWNKIDKSEDRIVRLSRLRNYLKEHEFLTEKELKSIQIGDPVIAEISLFYLLMCKYGRRMQRYYRLSLLRNFYPQSIIDKNWIQKIRGIASNYSWKEGGERFYKYLNRLNFNKYCGVINKDYTDRLHSGVENRSFEEFKKLNGIGELLGVLEKIRKSPDCSAETNAIIKKYENGKGCYAVLEFNSKLYASFSGYTIDEEASAKLKKGLKKAYNFKVIYAEINDSMKYYHNYNADKNISLGDFKKILGDEEVRRNYRRMFSCAERKFFLEGNERYNVMKLIIKKGLSARKKGDHIEASIYVTKYPCYMCVRSFHAMERDYPIIFDVKSFEENKARYDKAVTDALKTLNTKS